MTPDPVLIPVLILVERGSGAANQGKEMQIRVWQDMDLQPSCSSGHDVPQDVGRGGVEYAVTLLQPDLVQRMKTGTREADLSIEVPLVFMGLRRSTSREIPAQLVGGIAHRAVTA